MIWFAFACAAILPVALDGLLTKADVDAPGSTARSRSPHSRGWPSRSSRSSRTPHRGTSRTGTSSKSPRSARRRATRRHESGPRTGRPTGSLADPRAPREDRLRRPLRTRRQRALDEIVRYGTRAPGWQSEPDAYAVVVVDDALTSRRSAGAGPDVAYRDQSSRLSGAPSSAEGQRRASMARQSPRVAPGRRTGRTGRAGARHARLPNSPPRVLTVGACSDSDRAAPDLAGARTVLEIGCGQGAIGAMLAREYDYRGIEPDPQSFDAAQSLLSGRITQATDPYATGQFDVVAPSRSSNTSKTTSPPSSGGVNLSPPTAASS